MPASRSPSHLWILSSEGALPGIDRRLERNGWVVHRLVALRFQNEDPVRLRERLLRWGHFDTLIVTSDHAIEAFVRPVLPLAKRRQRDLAVWAAGAATVRTLRNLGFRQVYQAHPEGAQAIGAALARGRRHAIVYPRSDRAGPRLARRLRARGHRVLDLVVYRTVPSTLLTRAALRALERGQLFLATSPSALAALRASIPPQTFHRLRSTARIAGIGERTQRSARGHGFRRVGRLSSPSVEGLTLYLAREARHAAR
jgi:uroporphyrinogen-III synthase